MYISYDYYRIFYYVAKYGSFTQAAEALLSNQPNITRTVKKLEHELGCTLFVRSNRGVSLTPEGEKLYAHVAAAVEHIRTAEKELSRDKSLQNGRIFIGASEIALHCLLLPVLKEFRRRYPGVHIHVTNHSTPQAVSALKDGLVDLALVTTPVDLPKDIKMIPLRSVQEAAVCGSSYSFLCDRQVSLKELAEYPIICLGPRTKTFDFYAELFSQNGLVLAPDIEAATTDQILPMVKNDLGIGFVPEEFLLNESPRTGVCRLQLREEIPARAVCYIRRTDRPLSIAAEQLGSLLSAYAVDYRREVGEEYPS